MSAKKLETILSLVEVADKNLKNAQALLLQLTTEKGIRIDPATVSKTPGLKSKDEDSALEVQEGYFDGENMIGDNGQVYPVPQNYASKTQLVVGDRMKWLLTQEREIFKLIQPAPRIRVIGSFAIEGDNYIVLVDEFANPVKILKASATYAIKNLGLKIGDKVALYVPKDATPMWGAFISVVQPGSEELLILNKQEQTVNVKASSNLEDDLKEFKMDEEGPVSEQDYF